MTAQREGFLGDILDKVKDIITDDDSNPTPTPPPPAPEPTPVPHPQPPVTPQCCGPTPKFANLGEDLTDDGPKLHDADCPNHPDNLAKEVVA
ncbi:hypothetical protein ABZ345_46845 [Lentzea sp. NPDC005914]|uniref:hypothetical protein n=1 Tax=Lentzea sp. NPDC005914 TaxID=3154572 RepID=UPI0033C551B3